MCVCLEVNIHREMRSTELVLLLVTVLFLIAMGSLRRIRKWRISSKLPPGNMGLPLIGETFSLMKPCSVTERGEFMERRLTRYGNIFASNLMGSPIIVSADAELNQFVLKNEPRLFSSKQSPARERMLGRGSLPVEVGDAHKKLKSPVLEFLNGGRIKTSFLEDADRLASLVLSSWREGLTISAKEEATKFSLYIMAKKIASMTPEDTRLEKLHREYGRFLKGLICFGLNVPGTAYWKGLQSRKNILSIFKEEREERLKKSHRKERTEEPDDFLTTLTKNPNLSPEQVDDLLLGMLFAGYDTTAKAITALIYFLEGCPRAVKQLRDEHLQVARAKKQGGVSRLAWDDYKNIEFTRCVINETLRIANIAAFLLKRASGDVDFKGYVIPRGHDVLVNITAVHLDPSHYEDPEQFNPWRWLGSPGTKMTNNFMPFGGGMRMCPGAELARLEMSVFLHHLILKYEWELAEPDAPIRKPLVEFPKGLPIRVRAISAEP